MKLEALEIKRRGNEFFSADRYDEALELYIEAIQIDPDAIELKSNQIITLKKLQRYDEALVVIDAVLALETDHVKARYHRAHIMELQQSFIPAYQAYLEMLTMHPDNEDAKKGKQRCLKHCRSEVESKALVLAIDLKLTPEGTIKILEFGRAVQSSSMRFQQVSGQKIELLLQTEMAKLGLPSSRGFLNTIFGTMQENNQDWAETLGTWQSSREFESSQLQTYRGYFCGLGIPEHKEPGVLYLDDDKLFSMITEDKIAMHDIFPGSCKATRPTCRLYPRRYDKDLARRIARAIPEGPIVIKVSDLTHGNGVIIIDRQELDATLKLLLSSDDTSVYRRIIQQLGLPLSAATDPDVQRQVLASPLAKWRTSEDRIFMVESYVASKPIRVSGKQYDPTMRVWTLVTRDALKIRANTFAAVWKLPKSALGEGDLRSQLISFASHQVTEREGAEKVCDEDFKTVALQIGDVLPKVFAKLWQADPADFVARYTEHTDSAFRGSAHHAQLLYARMLGGLGRYAAAQRAIVCASRINLENTPRLDDAARKASEHREQGVIYYRKGDYQKALTAFEYARDCSATGAITRWIGMTYKKLGQQVKAIETLKQALAIDPTDRKTQMELVKLTHDASYIPGMAGAQIVDLDKGIFSLPRPA